jgi:hypothetical protein
MRPFAPAVLVCLALASGIGGWLIATASSGSGANPPSTSPAAHPASPQKAAGAAAPAASIDNDAPARHARRTACLKVAKGKKLVGAKRSSYVKSCMGSS